MRRSLLLCALIFCTLSAAAQSNIRAAIEDVGKEFSAHVKKGDAAAIAGMYSSTAKVLPPNGELTEGRANIQRLWQGAFDSGMRDLSFEVLEVEKKGDSVYEVGKYSVKDAAGKEVDRGKYIVIYKREGGKWKLHRDIWNSSMPMPAPAK